jgi:hypothetical protein
MRDKCSLSRVTIVTRQEVNMQRECTLSSNTAFSSIVLWKNALFLSFILIYCSTNSDKYNIENFAFKDKTFEFHVPTYSLKVFLSLSLKHRFLMNINDTSNNVYFTKWKGHCVVYYSNFAMQTEQMEKQCWETCWRSFNIMKFGIFVIFPQVSIE